MTGNLCIRRAFLFLILLCSAFPFIKFQCLISQPENFYGADLQGSMPTSIECPKEWTQKQCQTWRKEIMDELQSHQHNHKTIVEMAKQRLIDDPYKRNNAEQWKAQQSTYFQQVKHIVTKNTNNNNNNIDMSPFSPWANFSRNSFADLSVLGFPKAGTSQLYNVLLSHPQVEAVFKRKEYCMDHGHFLDYTLPQNLKHSNAQQDLMKKLFKYHKHMLNQRNQYMPNEDRESSLRLQSQKNSLLVNACLQPQELEYHMAYTELPPDIKFFVLFRDPADWLWASWNFWVDKNLDQLPPVDHDWATPGIHYRSPELFHEIISSQELVMTAARRFRKMREQTVYVPRRLIHSVGNDRILFLKNEEMRKDKNMGSDISNFLEKLAGFTGLEVSQFNRTVAMSQTNCNAQKGFQNVCNSNHSVGAGYPITQNRPMLAETRQLIYIQFAEECHIWHEEFGVTYKDCLNAV